MLLETHVSLEVVKGIARSDTNEFHSQCKSTPLRDRLGAGPLLAACRRKVVAEKLLLGRFLIGWTFFPMPSTEK